MNEIKGMAEAFKEARVVYLTTFRDGEVRSRQMTNLNEDPYRMMWFPTYRDTRKVEDIGKNP
jgi:general stress protein 26